MIHITKSDKGHVFIAQGEETTHDVIMMDGDEAAEVHRKLGELLPTGKEQ